MRRVGINLLYLVPRQVGGTEIYARRLVAALAAERPDVEWICFCGAEAAAELPDPHWPGNVRVVGAPGPSAIKPLRLALEMTWLPAACAHHRVDLLHSLGTTSPLAGPTPRVVTVHDIIYEWYPDAFPAPARLGLQLLVPAGAKRARRVQVGSQATKDEIAGPLGLDPDKIDVIHHGLGMRSIPAPTPEAELRERLNLGSAPVLLSVSAALPHKNLDRLLRAMPRLEKDPLLVLVGKDGPESEPLRALAAELGISDRVRFTGWIEDAELEGLYRLAAAFVYPSLHEGFGLPVLEAMHRGVPVACADATSLPEVAGDAAILFDPRSEEAIAAACQRMLDGGPEIDALRAKGVGRAAHFTWKRSARGALASYERALR